jgi:hypothetical protein
VLAAMRKMTPSVFAKPELLDLAVQVEFQGRLLFLQRKRRARALNPVKPGYQSL